jgi:hypothetical protein
MAELTPQEIKDFIRQQCERWNAHDKEGYTKLWQSVAPDLISFEDPVGSVPKTGWDLWSDMWDRFNPNSQEQRIEHLTVCGNEAALYFYFRTEQEGEIVESRDIETWTFESGKVYVRAFWELPEGGVKDASMAEYVNLGGQESRS